MRGPVQGCTIWVQTFGVALDLRRLQTRYCGIVADLQLHESLHANRQFRFDVP